MRSPKWCPIARCSCGPRSGARTPRCRTARSGLGAFFHARGLGCATRALGAGAVGVRPEPIAILLSNCPEYVETMLGAYRARAVPFNVNHHYHPSEVAQLLDLIGAEAIVYHRRLGPLLAQAGVHADRLLVTSTTARTWSRCRAASRSRPRSMTEPRTPSCRRRHRTTSTWCAPAAPPASRRVCCGARATCTSPRWAAPKARLRERIARRRRTGRLDLVRGAAAHARGRAVDASFAALHNGWHRRAARRCCTVRRPHDPRDRRARARVGPHDRRRRLRPADRRRAAARRRTTCRRCSRSPPAAR